MLEGATRDQIPAMLQTLLVERFKLAAHKEDRPASAYMLVLDKSGPKFKEAGLSSKDAGQIMFRAGPGTAGFKGPMTMASLAHFLSNRLHQPVEDHTGLKGKYDIDLSWTPDPAFDQPGPYARAFADAPPIADASPRSCSRPLYRHPALAGVEAGAAQAAGRSDRSHRSPPNRELIVSLTGS
jgi:uncharacterized protein (TIGR03435 family)